RGAGCDLPIQDQITGFLRQCCRTGLYEIRVDPRASPILRGNQSAIEYICPNPRRNFEEVILRSPITDRVVVRCGEHTDIGNNICLMERDTLGSQVCLRIYVVEFARIVCGECVVEIDWSPSEETLWVELSQKADRGFRNSGVYPPGFQKRRLIHF